MALLLTCQKTRAHGPLRDERILGTVLCTFDKSCAVHEQRAVTEDPWHAQEQQLFKAANKSSVSLLPRGTERPPKISPVPDFHSNNTPTVKP